MGHIFVSYSHKDTTYAHGLADHLKNMGFDVWIDERLDYGSQWPHEIQKQLDSCDAFLLIMSPRSFASEWVQSELQRAKRKLKPIFPLLLEGDEPWLSVESTQYYDVRGENFPDARFYSALRRVVSTDPTNFTPGFSNKAMKPGHVPSSTPKARTGILFAVLVILMGFVACTGVIAGSRYLLPALQPSPTLVTVTRDLPAISQSTAMFEPTITRTPVLPTNTLIPPTPTLTFTPTITLTEPVPQEEYVNSGTYELGMRACPIGFAIAGVRLDRDQFLCRRVMRRGEEQFVETVIDSGASLTGRNNMHACPPGMYMRGLDVNQNDLLCSYDSRKNPPDAVLTEFEDSGSVGYDMHICPPSAGRTTFLSGIRADENRFLCGVHQP